jgi:phage portal protein BeeE
MELEVLCKKLREDTQRLVEEKATLEGMAESRNELITEIAKETGLDPMGEDAEDEEEDEDANDREDAATPLYLCPMLPHLRRLSRRKNLWRCLPSKKLL